MREVRLIKSEEEFLECYGNPPSKMSKEMEAILAHNLKFGPPNKIFCQRVIAFPPDTSLSGMKLKLDDDIQLLKEFKKSFPELDCGMLGNAVKHSEATVRYMEKIEEKKKKRGKL